MIKKMKPGDAVVIIEDGVIKKGIITKEFYFRSDQVIVNFNGTLKKVLIKDLAKIENDTVEKESDTIEKEDDCKETPKHRLKPEISISRKDYEEKTAEIIGKTLGSMGISGSEYLPVVALIMATIVTELFKNEVDE
ncbi:hypothetical protein [Anaerostipes hadrus]|uniref:hypothetical protein n=1 Tax=Anaerostipes hadrus TaxID=649756 RepID=UPI003564BF64